MAMENKAACPMGEALRQGVDGMEVTPRYIVRCEYCWPEFLDMGAFTYTQVRRCDYREALDCASLEEAEALVAEMASKPCPRCGKPGKLIASTDLDTYNEDRLLQQLNRLASIAR